MSAGRHAKHNNGKPRIRLYLLLIPVLLAAVILGGVSAKYITREVREHLFAAKEFYFTSNLLEAGGADYILNSNAGSVTFTLTNGADELRYSEDDIAYTVETTGGSLNKTSGTLTGGTLSSDSITLSGLQKGVAYTVTAKGVAGYKTTLKATFTLAEEGNDVYMHLDTAADPAYVLLTVWTENVSGDATVTFPTGLIPDNTDSAMKNVRNYSGTYASASFTDGANFDNTYSSHAYRFFRSDSRSYSVDQFDVRVGGHVADPGTP